ncbi:autophagy Atg28p [Cordyceps militaris CM01]|uniref:Autophagy Atg28p n=1 Tax=Cordyceps militaris (strain CM01) TaxID=983644 RepID=G3JID0_CORMM|nr:autophagy Atg28p [Cordyceps militaris CM01]EGX91880.1 autophagy Atg28p [Cordyceps militaris CM01]
MSNSSILDRISSPTLRSPILSTFRSPPARSSTEYQLHELDPRPEYPDMSRDYTFDGDGHHTPAYRDTSTDGWSNDAPSSAGSPSTPKRRAMFHGPPPPIAASFMKSNRSQGSSDAGRSQGIIANSTAQLGSLLFQPPRQPNKIRPDPAWRAFGRRERAIEQEIQQLLDLQATGLVAGSGRLPDDGDDYSGTGSSTPTGTFYSTATSKSRMTNSLHVPARSTKDGNVMPVRQPVGGKPLGLRSARAGLRKAMAALVELKREEDAHVDAALSERKKALIHLSRLSARQNGVNSELHELEENQEEPLGKEIRELGSKYNSLTQEIRQLEERLMAMRNQRKFVRDKMEDAQARRDAGLSGYRGALKDIDAELQSMMMHPSIQPLDPEVFSPPSSPSNDGESLGGVEFLGLIPERRTPAMATAWWEKEVNVLDQRRRQISKERQALEDGSFVWREVTKLVTRFESSLRQVMKTGASQAPASSKGKEKVPSQENLIRDQLSKMDDVVAQLERCLGQAESEGWNLLVCAIGAELEAFREAQDMLKSFFEEAPSKQNSLRKEENQEPQHGSQAVDESDNDVPPDLLGSTGDASKTKTLDVDDGVATAELRRVESENDVPLEFLAELANEESVFFPRFYSFHNYQAAVVRSGLLAA